MGSCHAECLADNFSSEDGSTSASTDVCDGYAALIDGVCSSICSEENGEDQAAFQNVRAPSCYVIDVSAGKWTASSAKLDPVLAYKALYTSGDRASLKSFVFCFTSLTKSK